jgi:hypothetical protein
MTTLVCIASKLPYRLTLESGAPCVTLNAAKQHAAGNPELGITGGVDQDVFDAWCAANSGSSIVTQSLIFKMV